MTAREQLLRHALAVAVKAGWRNEFERGWVACNYCDMTAITSDTFRHRRQCLTQLTLDEDDAVIKDACYLAVEIHTQVRG